MSEYVDRNAFLWRLFDAQSPRVMTEDERRVFDVVRPYLDVVDKAVLLLMEDMDGSPTIQGMEAYQALEDAVESLPTERLP